MTTLALRQALDTRTGDPISDLALIRMCSSARLYFKNPIYVGTRASLAISCAVQVDRIDRVLRRLAAQRHLRFLEDVGPEEAWVCFPRRDLDLQTLRTCWRAPKQSSSYRPPSADVRLAVYERDGYRCVACGWAPVVPPDYDGRTVLMDPGSRRMLELDHRIPRSAGGRSEVDNLQALCTPCNASKGARV